MGNYYSKEYKVMLIEFLTKEEKAQKSLKLKEFYDKMSQKGDDEEDYDFIGDPFSQYKTSFRQEVKIYQPILPAYQINQYIENINELSQKDHTFQEMAHFFKRNVHKWFILYDEKEISILKNFEINIKKLDQIPVLEIIYLKKSFGQQVVYYIEKGTRIFWKIIGSFFNFGTFWFVFKAFIGRNMVMKMVLTYFFPLFALIPF